MKVATGNTSGTETNVVFDDFLGEAEQLELKSKGFYKIRLQNRWLTKLFRVSQARVAVNSSYIHSDLLTGWRFHASTLEDEFPQHIRPKTVVYVVIE
jgi:hypothetical protein